MFSKSSKFLAPKVDLPSSIAFSASKAKADTLIRFCHQSSAVIDSKKKKKDDKGKTNSPRAKSIESESKRAVDIINNFNQQNGQSEFKAQREEVSVIKRGGQRIINIGLGPVSATNSNLSALRTGVRAAVKTLKRMKINSAEVQIPRLLSNSLGDNKASFFLGVEKDKNVKNDEMVASHMSRWFEEANFKDFSKYSDSQSKLKAEPLVEKIQFSSSGGKNVGSHALAGGVVGNATNTAKLLGNIRPEIGTPKFYSDFAEQLCKSSKGAIKIRYKLVGNQLEKKGHNLHWNVGKGSEFPPYLVVMEYIGAPALKHSTAIVGKGVTFDTGGLHVKPYGYMEDMHLDMCGAAAVLGTMQAVSKLKLKTNVVGVLGLAENAIGKHAYRPSSILKSLKGSTVEILNTDAEGRLVLADCLTFIQDNASALKKKPDTIIDLATLTGAVTRALGDDRAGLFSNNHELRNQLYTAGEEALEALWPLPVGPEHVKVMKGDMSDLRNVEKGAGAGASTAAAFLQHFINDEMAWAHLDIAGTASGTGTNSAQKGGASGYGVALLTQYLRSKAQK